MSTGENRLTKLHLYIKSCDSGFNYWSVIIRVKSCDNMQLECWFKYILIVWEGESTFTQTALTHIRHVFWSERNFQPEESSALCKMISSSAEKIIRSIVNHTLTCVCVIISMTWIKHKLYINFFMVLWA